MGVNMLDSKPPRTTGWLLATTRLSMTYRMPAAKAFLLTHRITRCRMVRPWHLCDGIGQLQRESPEVVVHAIHAVVVTGGGPHLVASSIMWSMARPSAWVAGPKVSWILAKVGGGACGWC